jgi:hypothetical protein
MLWKKNKKDECALSIVGAGRSAVYAECRIETQR